MLILKKECLVTPEGAERDEGVLIICPCGELNPGCLHESFNFISPSLPQIEMYWP